MLPALAFALLPADPAARLDAFLKAHPTFVATVEASANGKTVGTGILRIARPHRLRFDAKGPGFDWAVSSTENAYIEVERLQRIYDERASIGGFRVYPSRISGANALIPGFLLAGSTANVLGGGKPTATPVAGGDALSATIQSQTGPVELRVVVDPQGRPIAFSSKGSDGLRAWRLLAFDAGTSDPAAFRIDAPLGYVPYALPELPTPLAIGEAAPLTGWRKGGRTVDLNEPQRGRPRLLAIVDKEYPSRAARPFLIDLGKSMPVFLIGPGDIVDPSGALLKRLSPPGTPMFYLVGPDGAVRKLWLGFDPAKGAAWEAEVRAAAQGSAKPPTG